MNDNRVTDQHMVHAGCAQFAECDFLLVGRYGGPSILSSWSVRLAAMHFK
jgi:hypothetical protein